ncbi:MAG: HAD-IA family hydrolase, partial [Pseudomonadota bacterium]
MIFDLDGTLIDSIGGTVDALNGVLKTLGRRRISRDDAIRFSGDGAAALVARAVAATGVAAAPGALDELILRYERLRHARADQTAALFPGVTDALARLAAQGAPMAICTNRPFRNAAALAARFGLDRYVSEIIGADTLGARKPDPAPVREALRRLGVAPADAVFVGDAAEDRDAARAAGL